MKTKGVGKLDSFEHIRWHSNTKADKCSSCYLSEVYFQKQIIILFWVIIYSYLQRFFKVGILKTLYTIHRKRSVSKSRFNQPVFCYFFDKRLWRFLVDIAKLPRTPFLQELLETPDSIFMEHICDYDIIKFNVNYPKWLFEPFETKCCTCEIKITWTWEIVLFLLFWFCKICY